MAGLIFEKMSAAMNDIGAVGKNQTNDFQKYRFRGIDDVMNALYPVLTKHHLFIVPEVTEKQFDIMGGTEGKSKTQMHAALTIKYTMYAEDGSSISATVVGEGLDSSDKAFSKAMSVGMKYALFQMFCIPTEEMRKSDSDNYSPQLDDSLPHCDECSAIITGVALKGGDLMSADEIIKRSRDKYGKCLCFQCCTRKNSEKKSNVSSLAERVNVTVEKSATV